MILSKRLFPLVACVVGAALVEAVGKPKMLEVLVFVFVFGFREPKGFEVVFVFGEPKGFAWEFAFWPKMADIAAGTDRDSDIRCRWKLPKD